MSLLCDEVVKTVHLVLLKIHEIIQGYRVVVVLVPPPLLLMESVSVLLGQILVDRLDCPPHSVELCDSNLRMELFLDTEFKPWLIPWTRWVYLVQR